MSAPHADLLRDLRELPFHAHVIKYDPARSVGGGYDDGSWTSMSDIGQPFDGERLTIERYAAVEQAHLDVLRAMARESGIDRLRRAEHRLILAIDPALEEVRTALREETGDWLWLDPDRRFYIVVGYDFHLYCGSHVPCPRGLALAEERGLHPRLEGPSPWVVDD